MKYDVVVVGAGMAGLSCALGLAQKGFKVAVVEAMHITKVFDTSIPPKRVSAINATSKNFLRDVGVWHGIARNRVNDYVAMYVWDQNSNAKLSLKAEEFSLINLGVIVENDIIVAQLYQALSILDVSIFEECKIIELIQEKYQNSIKLTDGSVIESLLIIGADGVNSFVRQQYGFNCKFNPYKHHAIITNAKTEKPHQDIAYQRFLKNGVLALLPLSSPYLCSVVYSVASVDFPRFDAMNDKSFSDHLSVVSEGKLGALELQSRRMSFELIERHVDQYYKPGVVLISDAAHTIHPLAGQGINLGFADVNALIKVLVTAKTSRRNIADISTLAKYARERKFENQLTIHMMQGLKQLFCNNNIGLSSIRAFGLNVVNNSKLLKRFFVESAGGL